MADVVYDYEVLLGNFDNADKGFGGGVEKETEHHGVGLCERGIDIRGCQILQSLYNTGTDCDGGGGEDWDEEEAGIDDVKVIRKGRWGVWIWMKGGRLESAGANIANEGGFGKTGIGKRGDGKRGLREEIV